MHQLSLEWSPEFSANQAQVAEALAKLTNLIYHEDPNERTIIARWKFTPTVAILKLVAQARLHRSFTIFDFRHVAPALFHHLDLIVLGPAPLIETPSDPNIGLHKRLSCIPTGHLCLYNNAALRDSANCCLLRAAKDCSFALCLYDDYLGGLGSLFASLETIMGMRSSQSESSTLLIVWMRTHEPPKHCQPLIAQVNNWATERNVMMITYADLIRSNFCDGLLWTQSRNLVTLADTAIFISSR